MSCMQEYDENKQECPFCGYRIEDQEKQEADHPDVIPPETILQGRYILGRLYRTDHLYNVYVTWDALLEKKVLVKEYCPKAFLPAKGQENGSTSEEYTGINHFEYGRIAFEEESDRLIRNQDIAGTFPVFRRFRERETSFHVSEYVTGDSLEDILKRGVPLSQDLSGHLFSSLCGTVDQIHTRGILHLNLCLKCVFVDEEWNGRLTDFGYTNAQLLRFLPEDPDMVSEYMAPEIYSGNQQGELSDIYSLGAVGKKIYQCAQDIPFRQRSRIRKALNRALNPNPVKRPADAALLWRSIE